MHKKSSTKYFVVSFCLQKRFQSCRFPPNSSTSVIVWKSLSKFSELHFLNWFLKRTYSWFGFYINFHCNSGQKKALYYNDCKFSHSVEKSSVWSEKLKDSRLFSILRVKKKKNPWNFFFRNESHYLTLLSLIKKICISFSRLI